ncbi:unnamed protein product [Staurois parvus]|uniref:Uncharacterized protein n=1 Tax=Staurois parvus TaxID=386267 RepID=A0ABN9GTJ1_9NEOB|nr:unnamed protein product [Staurois parvus]
MVGVVGVGSGQIGKVEYNTIRAINVHHWQGRTDNSWGPRAIGDHEAPVSSPKLKKAYEKGTRGISWGPPTDPGPSGSARVSKWSVHP